MGKKSKNRTKKKSGSAAGNRRVGIPSQPTSPGASRMNSWNHDFRAHLDSIRATVGQPFDRETDHVVPPIGEMKRYMLYLQPHTIGELKNGSPLHSYRIEDAMTIIGKPGFIFHMIFNRDDGREGWRMTVATDEDPTSWGDSREEKSVYNLIREGLRVNFGEYLVVYNEQDEKFPESLYKDNLVVTAT